jgi:hypothetical protein
MLAYYLFKSTISIKVNNLYHKSNRKEHYCENLNLILLTMDTNDKDAIMKKISQY